MLIAHIRHNDHVRQSVQEHLEEVAILARKYGGLVGLGAHAELAGFLHDMGKFTLHFTNYLQDAVLENKISGDKIDHSTAGAKYLYEKYKEKDFLQDYVIETVGMAILSHHSGMQNFIQPDLKPSDYIRRVTNVELPYYEEVVANFERIPGNVENVERLVIDAKQEMQSFIRKVKSLGKNSSVYLTLMQKLVFSCLIDADRTNTRCFEENSDNTFMDHKKVFEKGYKHLMETVVEWQKNSEGINALRNDMSESCDKKADLPSAIYTLTIPTGGGKTFASLRYALKHAKKYNKSRIIYVVPYTTILEQNAKEVRNIIKQPEAVLEHHANVIDDKALDNDTDFYDHPHHKSMQLGRDNWDYPIIFTTMVQYLDAFYQKGTRKSRRLHNLTNAIVIFDEAQSVPYQHKELFHASVNFLHGIGNSSIVLCTATQPANSAKIKQIEMPLLITEEAEMIPHLDEVVDAFTRVNIISKVDLEGWDATQIASFTETLLEDRDSVLIILNTKTAARKLYRELEMLEDTHIAHLSTSMCPMHRKEVLEDVKSKLGKQKVVCVSTQLIEAGVDISFESVIRSLAGLDSIAQAAGRCNRHAERELGDVYVIRAKDENLSRLPEIRIGAEVTDNYILSNPEFIDRLLHPKTIEIYFTHFLAQAKRDILVAPEGLDYDLLTLLKGTLAAQRPKETKSSGMFKTIEKYFEAIHSPTTAVLVPYGEGEEIIASLNEQVRDFGEFNKLIKKAQQYSVNLYSHELRILSNEGLIESLYEDSILCLKERAYDVQYGVTLEGQAKFGDYNF
ncbi:CRISPR-associated helicase/endonuclease Cas3 [Sporosarcina sp. P1]|uniref:CRISPR-associated helicase/endonuclease Cas3 n=1 Tax=Sporosarcina sp. P1 TaxID=2048257 RepID=UPI000C16A681|nr:CRISPR-associated helicase/endonuclease Cas3 [Sporosarcina sp. P1]PIC83256.1 CRISPR-associated helicase/endonuclease Cas3 [Sporosarcina sp. P1]